MGPKSRPGGWAMGCWKQGSCENKDVKCRECDKNFSEYKEKKDEKST